MLGRELQTVKDAREIWGWRFGHDVAEVDVLTNARKVNVQPGQINTRKVDTAGRTRERRCIERERALERRLVHAEHAAQIHTLLGLALQFIERLAGKHVCLGVGKLLLHNLRIGGALHKLASQRMRIGNARSQRARVGRLVGSHHAHNAHVNAVGNLGRHKVGIARHVSPHAGLFVFAIGIGRRQHLKRRGQRIVVGKVGAGLGRLDLAVGRHGTVDQVVELIDIQRTDAVERVVTHRAAARKHHHGLVGRRRPMAGNDIVLAVEQALVVNHLVKDRGPHGFHAHRCRRARAAAHGLDHRVGYEPNGLLVALVQTIDNRRHTVTILDSVDLFIDTVAVVVKPCLKACHIVRFNTCEHVLYGCDHRDLVGSLSFATGSVIRRALTLGRLLIRSPIPAHHG